MINPAPGVKKQTTEPPAPLPLSPGSMQVREGRSGLPEAQVAERQKPVPSSDPVLDVRLDGETMRLYTEIRDPETNRVLFRLPATYQGEDKDRPPEASFEA